MIAVSERLLDKNKMPESDEIRAFLGKEASERLAKLEEFLNKSYDIRRELKFPFGDSYGWGYKYSHKSKMLCYVFFEKGGFTVTISIGKNEITGLCKIIDVLLPKTRELWENRYPCGDGGWIHYRAENDGELMDIEKLIRLKKKPKIQ